MSQQYKPKRIVFRFRVGYELETAAIINTFFAIHKLDPRDDYFSHLMAPNESTIMYIVLDMNCRTAPTVDLDTMEYEVFKVKKNNDL